LRGPCERMDTSRALVPKPMGIGRKSSAFELHLRREQNGSIRLNDRQNKSAGRGWSPRSTSWGSLVRAQYRPPHKGPGNPGGFCLLGRQRTGRGWERPGAFPDPALADVREVEKGSKTFAPPRGIAGDVCCGAKAGSRSVG